MSVKPDWRLGIRQIPWVHTGLLIVVLTIYVLTLSPTVLGGDVGELQFVPYILGMAHPTGTPTYTILGKLWVALPLGSSVAWRMNLLSAVSASLAAVVVYHHVWWYTKHVVPALAAALTLAFGVTFWEQASMADKYAFNALLVALVLYLTLRWGKTRSPATLNLLALTYGLSLTHHRSMVLFAPTLFGYVWWREKSALWHDWRRLLRLAMLMIAPLLFYLYLPWAESRNLPPGTWHPRTLRDWYHYLMDTGMIGRVHIDVADLGERLLFYARTLQHDFAWIGVILGVGGLLWQFRRRSPDATFLLVNFTLQAFLAANHRVSRHWIYFVPSFVIFTLWIGQAWDALWIGIERLGHRWKRLDIALAALALVMLTLTLVPFRNRYDLFRDSHDGAGTLDVWRQELKQGRMGERLGKAIAGVTPGAIIVGDWEQATPLWYYQQVEGLRPDVEIMYPMERLEEAAASGRPLYVARNHPGLADRWHPWSSGSLIALHPEPVLDLPPDVSPLGIPLGDSLELAGFAYGEAEFHPGTVLPVALYCRALSSLADDYSVSLRLFDDAGQVVFQLDSQHPVLGTYPTSRWMVGEIVADYYEIELYPSLRPGTYQWGVVLYRTLLEGGWENLRVAGTDAEVAIGGTFQVRAR